MFVLQMFRYMVDLAWFELRAARSRTRYSRFDTQELQNPCRLVNVEKKCAYHFTTLGSWLNPAFFEWVVNPNNNTPRMQASHSEDSSIEEMSSMIIRPYPTPLSPTFGINMMQLHQNTQYKFNTAQHEILRYSRTYTIFRHHFICEIIYMCYIWRDYRAFIIMSKVYRRANARKWGVYVRME